MLSNPVLPFFTPSYDGLDKRLHCVQGNRAVLSIRHTSTRYSEASPSFPFVLWLACKATTLRRFEEPFVLPYTIESSLRRCRYLWKKILSLHSGDKLFDVLDAILTVSPSSVAPNLNVALTQVNGKCCFE